MANSDWNSLYRTYTPEELATEVTSLKSQMTIFTQQSIGSKSLTRDLGQLKERLVSAAFVQKERAQPQSFNYGVGVTDFSQIR